MTRLRNARGQGARLRTELIAAARRLVQAASTKDALSIRAVAKEAGVAATSVYLHFRDCDELFRAAVADDYRQLADAMRAARDAAGDDPIERLKAIGRAYCAFATDRPGSYRLITEVAQPVPEGGPRPQGHPAKAAQSVLERAIEGCQAVGYATTADRDVLLACLWSGWHGFVQLRAAKPQREWPGVHELVDTLVDGLLSAEPNDLASSPSENEYRST